MNDLSAAKQEMREKSRPYQAYGYYIAIPILAIFSMLVSIAGYKTSSFGGIIFVFTIVAHVYASKLKEIRSRKYVAPILIYAAQGLSFVGLMLLFSTSGVQQHVVVGLIGLAILPIEIVAFVFFFLSAHDIKKAYPDMKAQSKAARAAYIELKRQK